MERIVREGLYYRLSDPATADLYAWEFAAEDGSEAVVNVVVARAEGYGEAKYVVPRGLERTARYREVNSGVVYPAAALMDMGLPLPVGSALYMARSYHFVRVDE